MLKGKGFNSKSWWFDFELPKFIAKNTFRRGKLRILKLRLGQSVFLWFYLVEVLFILAHLALFPLPLQPLDLLRGQENVSEMLVVFTFFLMLSFNVLLFLVELVAEYILKLFLDVLLSSDLSFVVKLAPDSSFFDAFVYEFGLIIVSLLERIYVLALDIFLIVHDHLVVLI